MARHKQEKANDADYDRLERQMKAMGPQRFYLLRAKILAFFNEQAGDSAAAEDENIPNEDMERMIREVYEVYPPDAEPGA
jgi:hypothetical protein